MQVCHLKTARVRENLKVATLIAFGETAIDLRNAMEGLVHITNVVDDQSEGERSLLGLLGEEMSDLVEIG